MIIFERLTSLVTHLFKFEGVLIKQSELDQGRDLWRNYKNNNNNGRKPLAKKYSKNDIKLMMLAIDEENELLKSHKSNFE